MFEVDVKNVKEGREVKEENQPLVFLLDSKYQCVWHIHPILYSLCGIVLKFENSCSSAQRHKKI